MDIYSSFSQLNLTEVEGVDFRIHRRMGESNIAIVAPHGGKIERGTMSIADHIAGQNHHFYCFEGMKPTVAENKVLHITSNRFDEPVALSLVRRSGRVITIHGAKGNEVAVYAGGLDMELRCNVLQSIRRHNIVACDDPSPTRQGRGKTNICNRGKSGKGLQLEFTYGLRQQIFSKPNEDGIRLPNAKFFTIVEAIREGLNAVIF